jgi:hypothetical protein
MHELDDPTLERRPLEEHVAATGRAPDADVGTEAVDKPPVASARVAAPEADEVAEVQLDDGMA